MLRRRQRPGVGAGGRAAGSERPGPRLDCRGLDNGRRGVAPRGVGPTPEGPSCRGLTNVGGVELRFGPQLLAAVRLEHRSRASAGFAFRPAPAAASSPRSVYRATSPRDRRAAARAGGESGARAAGDEGARWAAAAPYADPPDAATRIRRRRSGPLSLSALGQWGPGSPPSLDAASLMANVSEHKAP